MFKRYEHRGHVLLQFIPLRIYKFCLFQFSRQDFSVPEKGLAALVRQQALASLR